MATIKEIKEKARRYDESMDRAKKELDACGSQDCEAARQIFRLFPELRESEGERIRKGLIEACKKSLIVGGFHKDKVIAWLEKQGEHANFLSKIKVGDMVTRNKDGVLVNLSQLKRVAKKDEKQGEKKPTEWSEEDENRINRLIAYFEDKESFTAEDDVVYANWLKSLKERIQPQKQEWSKEDKEMMKVIIEDIHCGADFNADVIREANKRESWLKSLKNRVQPHNTWKPSDEQMKGIECTIKTLKYQLNAGDNRLNSLYNDLKKLREE